MIDLTKLTPVRVVVLFDTAGFLQTLPLTGAAARTLDLNRHLAGHGVDVTLLLCDLNPRSQPSKDWPFPVYYLNFEAMYGNGDQLKPMVSQLGPDVVVMSNTELTVRYGRHLADAAGATLIYEMHDNEAELSRSIGSSPTKTRQAAALQSAAVCLADAVITFTGRDRSAATAMGATRVSVVPCGVSRSQPPASAAERRPAAVAFVGNLFYEPNIRAIRFLHGQVRERLTSLGGWIDVYGRYPSTLRHLAIPGIRLHGPVVDLQAALGTAAVGVAPLDCGGGMKLKVLSYMAAGLPVVGTREALVGLPDPHTFALVSTDKAMADFPDLVTGLVHDRALRRRLGQAGRRLALNRFSWPALAAHAADIYRNAAHHTTSPHSTAQVPVGGNRPGMTTPSVLGHNHVPGALSWVAMSKLPGQPPTDASDRDATGLLGALAARLHTTAAQDLADLPTFVRNIRPLPADTPTQATRLATVLDETKHRQLAHCRPGFVHGDFSARNILLAPGHHPGVIDFEGCGVGCVYEDLTNLYVQNCLIDGRDIATVLAGYHAEHARLTGEATRIDPGHLLFHTALYLRWVLQWAPEVDPTLAAQILALVAPILDALENDPDRLP